MWKNILIVLFSPFLLARHNLLVSRRKNAIRKAKMLAKKSKKHIHVFQIGRKFKVGTREELRRLNGIGRKNIKRATGSHLYGFDYRASLVYTAKYQ